MKPAFISHRAKEGILWMIYLVIIGLFAFGAAVNVDFVDPEVPLFEAWKSMNWKLPGLGSIPDDFRLSLATSFVCMILHGTLKPWKHRVCVMIIGLLVPVFSVGIAMFPVAAIAPWMVGSALAGKVDGEFYEEGMMMIAATGLWMLLSLATAIIDSVRGIRMERKSGEPVGPPSLSTTTISAISPQPEATSGK
jgi:hypothetical protein